MLPYANVCWRMLTYAVAYARSSRLPRARRRRWHAGVCWRMLAYAGVCWRMLAYAVAYAGVCWRMLWRMLADADA
jgi:hypothetical protein